MDLREVNLLLRRHRRSRLRPWRCRCGAQHPCPCRQNAEFERRWHEHEAARYARRPAYRIVDGDQVPVPGYRRYTDMVPPGVPARRKHFDTQADIVRRDLDPPDPTQNPR